MATGTHAARGELALLGALSIAFATLTLREASPHDAFEVISRLFWRSASARPPILLVVILVGWAGVVHCGQVAGLRLSRALGEGVLSPRIILRSALGLLDVILLCRLVPFVAQVVFETEHFGRWCLFFDLVAYAACILLLAAPPSACCGSDEAGYSSERCKAHQRYDHGWLLQTAHGRSSLLRTLIESLCAPFAPVTFWHVIVADYATSMAKALGDVHVTGCVAWYAGISPAYSHLTTDTHGVFWEETRGACVTSELNAWALALPFWCRLFQCLSVLRRTGEPKNFWNAVKYATAFPLVYAGYLDRLAPTDQTRRLVVLTACVQSSATFAWDLCMDWGLFKKRRGGLLCGIFEVDQMREPKSLVFSKRSDMFIYAAYAGLVLFNFSLRFAWALAVFGHVSTRGMGMLSFEIAELARRTVWALFRIEWEYHERGWPLDTDSDNEETEALVELVETGSGRSASED